MTTFRLEKQSPGKTLTKFFVYDDKDSIVGTINVANETVSDFLAHWKGAPPQSSPKKNAANASKQISAMVAASRNPSRQAVLRGC
jgi:hypothetical protein